MLCPEVWNFAPPTSSVSIKHCHSEEEIFEIIKNQYFNHCVSITLPNTLQVPNNVVNTLQEDSQFYRINNISPVEFLKKDFIRLFVTKGQLTVISINKEVYEEENFAITPNGKLILSLSRETYQQLGIQCISEKLPKYSMKKHLIVVDLVSESSKISKNCLKLQERLTHSVNLHFDVILAWESHDIQVCPSSIAYYFSKKGYSSVKTCDIDFKSRHSYNVGVPLYDDESDIPDLIEWLGAFSLQCSVFDNNYISTFKCPEKYEVFGQVVYLKFTGLFTVSRIQRLLCELSKYTKEKASPTWISMTVQGFEGSITALKNSKLIQCTGDHLHTVIFKHGSPSLVCTFLDIDKEK